MNTGDGLQKSGYKKLSTLTGKFFGRTKFFYNQTVDIDNYGSIDEAVRTVIANGLEKEAHGKVIDEKWKKWDEKT